MNIIPDPSPAPIAARKSETSHNLSGFAATMADTTRLMSASRRIFSKTIHAKGVSATSELIGSTLARPNALLVGAVCSFALTLFVYIFSKNLGYSLSGFESIGAFIIGWLLGIGYDYLKLLVTGKP